MKLKLLLQIIKDMNIENVEYSLTVNLKNKQSIVSHIVSDDNEFISKLGKLTFSDYTTLVHTNQSFLYHIQFD